MNTFTGSTKESYEEMSNILYKQGETEKGEILARLMSSYMCNGRNTMAVEGFVDYWSSEHRTIQQSFTMLVLHWIRSLYQKEKEGLFDLRNAYSVGFAKGVVDCLKDYDYKYGEGERMVQYLYDFNVNDRFDEDRVIEFPLI